MQSLKKHVEIAELNSGHVFITLGPAHTLGRAKCVYSTLLSPLRNLARALL